MTDHESTPFRINMTGSGPADFETERQLHELKAHYDAFGPDLDAQRDAAAVAAGIHLLSDAELDEIERHDLEQTEHMRRHTEVQEVGILLDEDEDDVEDPHHEPFPGPRSRSPRDEDGRHGRSRSDRGDARADTYNIHNEYTGTGRDRTPSPKAREALLQPSVTLAYMVTSALMIAGAVLVILFAGLNAASTSIASVFVAVPAMTTIIGAGLVRSLAMQSAAEDEPRALSTLQTVLGHTSTAHDRDLVAARQRAEDERRHDQELACAKIALFEAWGSDGPLPDRLADVLRAPHHAAHGGPGTSTGPAGRGASRHS